MSQDRHSAGSLGITPFERMVREAETQLQHLHPVLDVARVAASAEVASQAAHSLFPDSQSLILAVLENALVRLTDHLVQCTTNAAQDDPVAQLMALLHGYVDWCFDNRSSAILLTHPALMGPAVERSAGPRRMPEDPAMPPSWDRPVDRYSVSIHFLTRTLLTRAQAEGRLREGVQIPDAAFNARALCFGLMVLSHSRQGDPYTPEAMRALCDSALRLFATGLFPECDP